MSEASLKENLLIQVSDISCLTECFLNKVVFSDNCWIWAGSKNKSYGRFFFKSFNVRAHRLSYLLFNGPLKNNEVIDHICSNKICVNPAHLRQVSYRINTLENSNSIQAKNYKKTHCKNGHELSVNNLYIQKKTGFRYCLICNRLRQSKYKEKICKYQKRKEL